LDFLSSFGSCLFFVVAFASFLLLFKDLHIKERHNLLFTVMFLDELLYFPIYTRDLCDIKNRWSLVFILIKHSLNQKLEVAAGSLGQRLTLLIDDHVKY
jgi:hypothetical protein